MLKREYKWRGLNILEIHYLENVSEYLVNYDLKKIDVIKFYQVGENYKNNLDQFYTLHINLENNEDDIFKQFHSNTRNEIRKNLRDDQVSYEYIDEVSEDMIIDFMNDLDIFMKQKGNIIDKVFLIKQALDFKNNIILTYVKKNDNILAKHLYLCDGKRARYKSGISYRLNKNIDAKLVGRSNRGLHWFDIKMFKSKNFKIYDLGGIAYNTKDKAKLNINKFKERFTKNLIIEYEGNIAISLKGKIALYANKILQKIKE
jgi:hypothetical protein